MKKNVKKLMLSRETISLLSGNALAEAAAGLSKGSCAPTSAGDALCDTCGIYC